MVSIQFHRRRGSQAAPTDITGAGAAVSPLQRQQRILTQHERRSALALAPLHVTLPPATAAALRLTCRAAKSGVDQSITELNLTLKTGLNIVDTGSALTTGLTSLNASAKDWQDDADISMSAFNVGLIAQRNSQSLELLWLLDGVKTSSTNGAAAAQTLAAMLGTHQWPRLRCFLFKNAPHSLFVIFNQHMQHSFGALRELVLGGYLNAADLATLSTLDSICAHLTVLLLVQWPDMYSACSSHMAHILEGLTRVKTLELDLSGARTVGFFAEAELPLLQNLGIHNLPHATLEPLLRLRRPRLAKLYVLGCRCGTDAATVMVPVLESAHKLPALAFIRMVSLISPDWGFLAEIQLSTLTALELTDCCFRPEDVAHVATAASRLSALKRLELSPFESHFAGHGGVVYPFFEKAAFAMQQLLSGSGLKGLELLIIGGGWIDDDESLSVLITHADAVPKLREMIFRSGRFTVSSLAVLTMSVYKWPELYLFEFQSVSPGGNIPMYHLLGHIKALKGARPNLQVKWESETDGAGPQ